MLQISDPAMTLLKDALMQERTNDEDVFRLEIRNDEFVLGIDSAHDDDIQYDYQGTAVLAAPEEVANSLLGSTTIDLENTAEGPRLVLVS